MRSLWNWTNLTIHFPSSLFTITTLNDLENKTELTLDFEIVFMPASLIDPVLLLSLLVCSFITSWRLPLCGWVGEGVDSGDGMFGIVSVLDSVLWDDTGAIKETKTV